MNILVIFLAKYLYIVLLAIAVGVVGFNKEIRKKVIGLSLGTLPLSFLTGKLLGWVYYNPRPFVVKNIQPLISHAADNGFPSDHTLLCATVASTIFVYNRKIGLFLFFLSLLVGGARVLAQIHSPVDVMGSFLIAILTTYIFYFLLNRFFKN